MGLLEDLLFVYLSVLTTYILLCNLYSAELIHAGVQPRHILYFPVKEVFEYLIS